MKKCQIKMGGGGYEKKIHSFSDYVQAVINNAADNTDVDYITADKTKIHTYTKMRIQR